MQPKDIVTQFIAGIHDQRFGEAKVLLVTEGFELSIVVLKHLHPDDDQERCRAEVT